MLELVELLAQNTHNVWAKDRIRQGWTYGLHEIRVGFLSFCTISQKMDTIKINTNGSLKKNINIGKGLSKKQQQTNKELIIM